MPFQNFEPQGVPFQPPQRGQVRVAQQGNNQQDLAGILQQMMWQNALGGGQLGGMFPSYGQQMQGPPPAAIAGLASANNRAAGMRQDSLQSIASVLGSYIPSYFDSWSRVNTAGLAPSMAAGATRDSALAGALGQLGSSAYGTAGDIYSAGIPAQMQYAITPATLQAGTQSASYGPQSQIYDSWSRETGRDRRMAALPGLFSGLLGGVGGGGIKPFTGFRGAGGASIS